jgi:23S rRNA (adenine2503-C2)-methyltransferase
MLIADGVNPLHAKTLWRALHGLAVKALSGCETFLAPLRRWISIKHEQGWQLDIPEAVQETHSSDGLTRKYLLRLSDGQTIETVLMSYDGRHTACVSTQVGCAMGCVFCATGQAGFTRHLRTGEILAQVLHVQRVLRSEGKRDLRNLVLMGMGEPLHNYDPVMKALATLVDRRGCSLSRQRITISTVGLVPAMLRMAEEKNPYNLALSLHGSNQEARASLIPVAKKWPLDQLIEACRIYDRSVGKRIFIEWTLIAGQNDSAEVAHELAHLLRNINVHINLIPLNPTLGYTGEASGYSEAIRFQQILREAGYPCTFRQRRGIDVGAGCGQLREVAKQRDPGRCGRNETSLSAIQA